MPRDRRTRRGAQARGSNLSTGRPGRNSSSRATVGQAPTPSPASSVTTTVPKLFTKFSSNRGAPPSVPQQDMMTDSLQKHIFTALTAFQGNNQQGVQVPGQQQPPNFAAFYDLVHQMTVHPNTRSSLYMVTHSCIREWFDSFAKWLTSQALAQAAASAVDIAPAQSMINFHESFFGRTLTFIAAALAPAERRELVNPKKPVLLHELCCRAFVESILRREPIRNYVTELVVVFFSRSRQRFHEDYLLKGDDASSLAQFMQANFGSAQSCVVTRSLLQMLIGLDRVNLSVFYRLVELPLVKRSLKHARQLSRDQLQAQPSMGDYLRWVANYLVADRYLLAEMFAFPSASAQAMTELVCHVMAATPMDSIVNHPDSGFAALLASQSYASMRTMYETICALYGQTRQSALLDSLEAFIERQFADKRDVVASRYNFKQRHEQLAYVADLLSIKQHWDRVLTEVFFDGPNAIKVNRAVFKFFYETLLVHEGVHQAVAFYLHSLMLKDGLPRVNSSLQKPEPKSLHLKSHMNRQFSLAHSPALLERLTALRKLSSTQLDRFASLYKLLGLVQYMKDANTFYDYSKHYFCSRLLAPGAAFFTVEQELEFFEHLTMEIKRVFVDERALMPHMELNSNQMLHKHFAQSLNDFKWIAADWRGSEDFWKPFITKPTFPEVHLINPHVYCVDSFPILHAGIWKLVEYDRCKLPPSIATAFRVIENEHLAKYKNRRLLLNSKHSKAKIKARLWAGQPTPLSLTVSLHQLAILEQFNAELSKPVRPIKYEQLVQGGGFLRENNAKLALLSLVHGGLLNVSSLGTGVSQLEFELNPRFYEAHKNSRIEDLSALEQVNFWSVDNLMDVKMASLVRALGVAEEDIYLASSVNSVEDVAANCAMILRPDVRPPTDGEQSATGTLASKSDSLISGLSPQVIERVIKIEAAIVRVLKRAKRLASLHEVYTATKMELASGRAAFPPTDVVTAEEVSKLLLKLVEKKYIKRDQTGGFEFLVD